jgi:2-polyprenyl-3-methyl-5-hydroxy-6-metoxy-1,4-benzoquinol methylase
MLKYALELLAKEPASCQQRVQFIQGIIPEKKFPRDRYDLIISNSLLHHLHQPNNLWQTIQKYSANSTLIILSVLPLKFLKLKAN